MKIKNLILFTGFTLLCGIVCLAYLFGMQIDPDRGEVINYHVLQRVVAGLIVTFLAFLLVLILVFVFKPKTGKKISAYFDALLIRNYSSIQTALLILVILLVEFYFLTYLAFPIPARPLFVFCAATCLSTWFYLRLVYADKYRQQPTLITRLREKWHTWEPVQRRTSIIIASLGLLYFLAFVPANLLRDAETHFYWHPDEGTIYPDIVKALTTGETFDDTVYNVFGNWPWWYGFPYLTISASVLLIPRLIFGPEFGQQIQLNIFLLRQFVSVLPMILSIGLLVYMTTGFRSRWKAVGLFVFMLLVPGVIMYCYHFWHPDSLVLLMVVGTIFFLHRDDHQFKHNFFYAAIACGLAAAIKSWGFFFFLTIAFYLLNGLVLRKITIKRMVWLGMLFIGVMALTIIISSPSLLIPWSFKTLVNNIKIMNTNILEGFNEPDPLGAYRTGVGPWLLYIDIYFMKPYFFFFAFITLLLGSVVGTAQKLSRLLFTWCIVLATYFMGFMIVKRMQYMMLLTIPLYASAFLFPALAMEGSATRRWLSFLNKPIAIKILWTLIFVVFGVQFVFNIINTLTSPWIGVFARP